jgi:hypothetical protein
MNQAFEEMKFSFCSPNPTFSSNEKLRWTEDLEEVGRKKEE